LNGATRQNYVANHPPIRCAAIIDDDRDVLQFLCLALDMKMVEVQFVGFHESITALIRRKTSPKALFSFASLVLRRERIANRESARAPESREKTEKSHLVCGMKICIFSTFQYATTKNTNVVCRSTVAA
jgi:hypothetical protein